MFHIENIRLFNHTEGVLTFYIELNISSKSKSIINEFIMIKFPITKF